MEWLVKRRLVILALGAVVVVGAVGASALAAPSEVIFPPQQLALTFSHARHLAKKIECDFCHDKAATSRHAADNLLPGEDVCATCHMIDREHPERTGKSVTACAACHPGFRVGAEVARVVVPPPNLKFDHAVHAERGVACTQCHDRLDRVDLATRAQLPEMSQCLRCHDSRRAPLHAPSRCATCHLTRPDNTVETAFASGTLAPSGKLRGDAHTLEFRTRHAAVAANDDRYCANCHRQDFCLACHNGVVKPLDFHGNDYVNRHAVDARRDNPRCESCHRGQTFCLGCHERLGVVDLSTGVPAGFTPLGGKRFHPLGWADAIAAGNPNHHAWQAQRQIRQCVSCHRQETCLQCHATMGSAAGAAGKMNINPHPAGWRGSTRCQALADRNARVCLRCHAVGDSRLSCR
jgi:hypothetical protein